MARSKGTTKVDYLNRNRQRVLGATSRDRFQSEDLRAQMRGLRQGVRIKRFRQLATQVPALPGRRRWAYLLIGACE